MTEPAPAVVANTVHLYLSTRQRDRRGMWGFLACWVAAALLGLFVKPWNNELAEFLCVPLIIMGMLFGLMAFIAQFQFLLIRCPRCGKRFGFSHLSGWPNPNCKHCRFPLPQPEDAPTQPETKPLEPVG